MNIELAVMDVYLQHPQLLDAQVDAGLGALISRYKAELLGREVSPPQLPQRPLLVFESVRDTTELMLGRPDQVMDTITLEETVTCLQRIRKSVNFWTKRSGKQGYLKFVRSQLHPAATDS
ncbi:hypothetical protein SAMN00790413_03319 [Deinococcus hopiensis KR-140]|uniref:Uncharacterized protein n=2 Tax=Deinococcus TaxID=1298 RepID=A0A1W1UVN3_9DEIO|nr:hypothetical protein SAMN00790413_03319 [Deinococcus hopiensis KR-140]